MKRILTLLPLIALGCLSLLPPAEAQRYHVRTYSETEGLPSSEPGSIAQTPDGVLWVTTRGGIASYDGISWELHGVSDELVRREGWVLRSTASGELWALRGRAPRSLVRRVGGRFEDVELPPDLQSGLVGFAVSADGGRVALYEEHGVVHLRRNGRWSRLEADPIRYDLGGVVFLGDRLFTWTQDGAHRLDESTDERVRLEPGFTGPLRSLAADPYRGAVWVIGESAFGRLDADGLHWKEVGRAYVGATPGVPLVDRHGRIVFGWHEDVFLFDPAEGLMRLGRREGLISEGLVAACLDREGCLWISCVRGLSKLVHRDVRTWDRAHGLAEAEVSALALRPGLPAVLGHHGALTVLESPPRVLRFSDERVNARVLDLDTEPDGSVWIAATQMGLGRAHPTLDRIEWLPGPESPWQVGNVFRSDDGTLYVAVGDDLYRGRPGAWEPIRIPEEMDRRFAYTRRIERLPDGRLAVSGQGGVLFLSGDDVRFATGPEPWSSVYDVLPRPDGSLWVGTGAGVGRIEGGRIVPVEEFDVGRPVFFLVPTPDGRLWIGTDNGVHVWSPAREKMTVLSVRQGLAGRETNRAAGVVDADGAIWIGTDLGLTVVRRSATRATSGHPVVSIEPPVSRGLALAPDRRGRLTTRERGVEFPFRAVSLVGEEQVEVRWRLEGATREWSDPLPAREQRVRFHGLAPGRVRLLLQARGAPEAPWTSPVMGPWIRIVGPAHTQWWFRTAVALLILVALGIAVAWAMARRLSRRLEKEVASRTAELRTEKDRLRATLHGTSDGILALDASRRVEIANPAAQRIFARSQEELVGRSLDELLPDADADGPDADGSVRETTLERSRADLRHLEWSAAPLIGEGERRVGWVCAVRDVTEVRKRRKAEERSHRLESVGLLAGGIAHDFNNQLMVILGNLSLAALTDGLPTDARRKVEEARAASLRARELTGKLLTFADGGAPVVAPVRISELLHETATEVLADTDVRWTLEEPGDLPTVAADEAQLKQAIRAVLANARQAMQDRGVLTVRASHRPDDDRPAVRIEVRDDGDGIASADLPRVLDAYFSTRPGRMGLGLATTHSIVSQHGGRLELESAEGSGTLVRIDLPLSPAAVPDDSVECSGPLRVLVVDDEAPVRLALSAMLNHLEHRSDAAADGDAALDLFRQAREEGDPYDAAVLDLTAPSGPDGVTMARRLRDLDAGLVLIAASGYSEDPVISDPERHGFHASLRKPFTVQDLDAALTAARNRTLRSTFPGSG